MTGRVVKILLLINLSLLIFSLPFLTSCKAEGEKGDKLGVVVTLLPQLEFAKQVGGNKVEASVMVPSGASPHTYEPKPSQLIALEDADIYFKMGSGIDFELVWLDKLLDINNDMILVDCSRNITLTDGTDEQGNVHGSIDPHIWMSPLNAVIITENICQGLIELDPGNRSYYEANRDNYIALLEALDTSIRQDLEGVVNRHFMVYHPSFGYLAAEYDLVMLAVEDEGKEPTPEGLLQLIRQAVENDIHIVFTEPQFNPQSAEVIAQEIGGIVLSVDPLAENYLDNMTILSQTLINTME